MLLKVYTFTCPIKKSTWGLSTRYVISMLFLSVLAFHSHVLSVNSDCKPFFFDSIDYRMKKRIYSLLTEYNCTHLPVYVTGHEIKVLSL